MSHKHKPSISGSGAPTSIVPEFIGQVYRDTTNNLSYIAKGLTAGDWEALIPKLESDLLQVYTKAMIGGVNADTQAYTSAVYGDKLYLGFSNTTAANDNTAAKIIVYDGSSWSVITKADIANSAGINPADMNADTGFWMQIYNNKLYIGTQNATAATDTTAAKMLVFDGASWSVITKATMGMVNADTWVGVSMAVYNNKLYAGTVNSTSATNSTAAKVCVFDGSSWSVITKADMGGSNADQYMWCMAIYNNKLYIGTYNATAAIDSTAAKLLTFDGAAWTPIYKNQMTGAAVSNNDRGWLSMAVYNGRLFLGGYNATAISDDTGVKIWILSNTGWSTWNKSALGGGTNANYYMYDMAVYNDKLYVGGHSTNLNYDDTGAKIYIYDDCAWGRFRKGVLGMTANDIATPGFAIYKGRLFFSTSNTTAATNTTAAKIISIKLGTYENSNDYCSRGF